MPAIARVFAQRIEGGVLFKWLATPAHCNGGGIVHGGMLSTLADTWLANNVMAQLPAHSSMVTTNLAVDYLRPVWPGQVVECAIDRMKIGSRLCHAAGVLLVDNEPVVSMRATFALIPSTERAAKKD
ncbi:PaaI family thioesterase [Amantichitinum ursilacus]|uniref:Thioesterase superfamily protein n=1 Tax=Amantichitinum ursilacus TaxID=857265 RepID=A0A0N0XKJ9_9NEIS|nr:PaaI family thioesterase [Amantichitinum ursilacus]KPC54668.1 Thioesterase superfamily protein [Amantichitinum ursilacus]